jgi:hypothetical protein
MRFGAIAITLLALGGASGGGGARFTFGPVESPLQYEVRSSQMISVETPMGPQENYDTVDVTVALSVGEATEGGHRLIASFDAIDLRSHSPGGVQRADGGALIGQRLPGTLHLTGSIDLDERPSLETSLSDVFDPSGFLTDLMLRMPADGNTDAPWAVRVESKWETALSVTGVYEGTAQIVGDTVWNGTPAKIIQFEAAVQLSGSGMPAGAPAEMELALSGTSARRYVWDPARGVMLAGRAIDDASGSISIPDMNLVLEAAVEGQWSAELKP